MSPGLSTADKHAIGSFANRWPLAFVFIVGLLVAGATIYWSTKALAGSPDMADYVKKTDLQRLEQKVDDGFKEQRHLANEILLRLVK